MRLARDLGASSAFACSTLKVLAGLVSHEASLLGLQTAASSHGLPSVLMQRELWCLFLF